MGKSSSKVKKLSCRYVGRKDRWKNQEVEGGHAVFLREMEKKIKEDFVLAHSFWVQLFRVGNTEQLKFEAAGDIATISGSKK